MGLDMYLYRITRLTDEEKKEVDAMGLNDIYEAGFCTIEFYPDPETPDDPLSDPLLKQILDYLYVIKRDQQYVNLDRLKKHFGIPEDAKRCGSVQGSGPWKIFFNKGEKGYEANLHEVPEKELERLMDTVEDTFGICKEEEVAYWRKHYDLQTKLHAACDVPVLNCGYYPLNKDMKAAIRRDGARDLKAADMKATKDSVVCYHEWY